jgi:LDH2 family malate/lactate/ureidoglycolate dehydrogenase
MKRFDPRTVEAQVTAIATAVGVAPEDAAILADSLVEADIYGVSTHGVSRLNIYVRRIQKGLIDPKATLAVDRQRTGSFAVDARNGLGQVQASKVLRMIMDASEKTGVAAATIRNSQHFGTLSYYCNKAVERGKILIAATNAEPSMSPSGGRTAYFGTNPIAASFPTGKGFPVRIDLATSLVARGNIIAASKRGESIPAGWALDEEGNPTTDAAAALAGTVLTMAGHKGYALALMVEFFSGVLSGAGVGSSVGSMYKHMDRYQNVGHFFCVLDIEAFMDLEAFKERVDRTIDEIKAVPRRPGVDEILIPGEPEHRKGIYNRERGVAIDDQTMKELETLCSELRVEFILG